MTDMRAMVDWAKAQVDEDERVARESCGKGSAAWSVQLDPNGGGSILSDGTGFRIVASGGELDLVDGEHIARWDPARVLAEVDAKRRVLRLYENALAAHRAGSISQRNRTQDEAAVDVLGEAVRLLAVVYADRPGYHEEWRL